MGISTNVIGFRPPDEKWNAMKKVYDSCEAAGISIPNEVSTFFNDIAPDPRGVEVELPFKNKKTQVGCVTEWKDDASEGVEVDVTKLPSDVTVIRFYNSW
jgi:hypothetical protein